MIRIGTAGWSYLSGKGRWAGIFYPADRRLDALQFYARFFDTVEVNNTFYRPVTAEITEAWASKTPPNFRFAVKLYQKFTHPTMFEEATGRAAEVEERDFAEFIQSLAPLAEAGKLGPLLAQFPPSFRRSDASLAYVQQLARRFEGYHLVVELRHKSWTEDHQVPELFSVEQISWVHTDEPFLASSAQPTRAIGPIAYLRFHGRNWQQWWKGDRDTRYDYLYAPREQSQLAERVTELAGRSADTYVAYNNHFGAKAVANGLQMKLMLGQEVPEDVPKPLLDAYPDLAELIEREKAERG